MEKPKLEERWLVAPVEEKDGGKVRVGFRCFSANGEGETQTGKSERGGGGTFRTFLQARRRPRDTS